MGRRREALNFKEINGPFIDCVEEFAYVTYLPTHLELLTNTNQKNQHCSLHLEYLGTSVNLTVTQSSSSMFIVRGQCMDPCSSKIKCTDH